MNEEEFIVSTDVLDNIVFSGVLNQFIHEEYASYCDTDFEGEDILLVKKRMIPLSSIQLDPLDRYMLTSAINAVALANAYHEDIYEAIEAVDDSLNVVLTNMYKTADRSESYLDVYKAHRDSILVDMMAIIESHRNVGIVEVPYIVLGTKDNEIYYI